MWSPVEKTALAEAEIEYHEKTSPAIYVKFPVIPGRESHALLMGAQVVIWTTTPWTIPGNRAISFSLDIQYGLYEVLEAPPDNWAKAGDLYVLAEDLAEGVLRQAKVTNFKKVHDVDFAAGPAAIVVTCSHPLKKLGGYNFPVPMLVGDHVTADAGTGFVHTAPGHGREDFEVWIENARRLEALGINTAIPYTVDENGTLTSHAPGFEGKRVLNDKGEKGDAN